MKNNKSSVAITIMSIIIVLFIALIIYLVFIKYYASQHEDELSTILVSSVEKYTPDFLKTFVNEKLGFDYSVGNFAGDFLIGLFSGLLVYFVYLFIKIIRFLKTRSFVNPDSEEYSEGKTRWLSLIVDRIWKVLIIAVLYATLLQIPILNKIIYILTLNFFFHASISKIIVLSFWIGFGPFIIENYLKARLEIKLRNKVLKSAKAAALERARA